MTMAKSAVGSYSGLYAEPPAGVTSGLYGGSYVNAGQSAMSPRSAAYLRQREPGMTYSDWLARQRGGGGGGAGGGGGPDPMEEYRRWVLGGPSMELLRRMWR
jgi:hypothetical protein